MRACSSRFFSGRLSLGTRDRREPARRGRAALGTALLGCGGLGAAFGRLQPRRRRQERLRPRCSAASLRRGGCPRRGASRPRAPAGARLPRGGDASSACAQAIFLGLALQARDAFLRRLAGRRRRASAQGVAGSTGGAGAGATAATGVGRGRPLSPGLPSTRRRLTSTTTLLVRPWLKVCLTSPASTERLSPSGLRVAGRCAVVIAHTPRLSFKFTSVAACAARRAARRRRRRRDGPMKLSRRRSRNRDPLGRRRGRPAPGGRHCRGPMPQTGPRGPVAGAYPARPVPSASSSRRATPDRACGRRPRSHRPHGRAPRPRPGAPRSAMRSDPKISLPGAQFETQPVEKARGAAPASVARRQVCRDRQRRALERPRQRALELAVGDAPFEFARGSRRSTPRGPAPCARASGSTSPSGDSARRTRSSRATARPGEHAPPLGTRLPAAGRFQRCRER